MISKGRCLKIIYTYKCTNSDCDNSKENGFDIELKLSEAPLKCCEKCGSEVTRVYKVNVNSFFEGSFNKNRASGK